jgi:hypothetical protein
VCALIGNGLLESDMAKAHTPGSVEIATPAIGSMVACTARVHSLGQPATSMLAPGRMGACMGKLVTSFLVYCSSCFD